MFSTCFARGMRSTAFPWAVVVLSAIWSGVHPVEVAVTSYISTKGDDARGDGSRTRPWGTYSRARARAGCRPSRRTTCTSARGSTALVGACCSGRQTAAPLTAASHPDGTAELHTQLFVQRGGVWVGGEPCRFGRRFTARSAVMSYSHASAVDPKRTASSTGQGKCKAPAITTRTTCSSRCSTAGLRRPTGLPASHR